MQPKEQYCYKILKSHSLIVDFKGKQSHKNVPKLRKGETFNKWKKRVLGGDVTDVVVYVPTRPAPQTKIKTLQQKSGAQHLSQIFRKFGAAKNKRKKAAIEETERSMVGYPRDALKDELAALGDSLEPSVHEFFNNFIKETEEHIDVEQLFRKILVEYNTLVKACQPKLTKQRELPAGSTSVRTD